MSATIMRQIDKIFKGGEYLKVCLYFEGYEKIKQSGIGKAMQHQTAALKANGIDYTLDADDDYDILHINTIFFKSRGVIKKARRRGAKVIYHAHSTPEDTRNSFLFSNLASGIVKRYLISLYKKADFIITPTPYSKSLVEKYVADVPVRAVSNGIDLNRFCTSSEKAEKFRNYFGLKKDEHVIVSAGLWIKRKGILDFIEVARRMPDIKFIWFGHTNPALIPREIRRAVKSDHPSNVIFPGYMSGDVFEGAFAGADLFFFPSLEETEGIVILEALASRALTVIRDIPVYDGWMENGVNCYKGKNIDEFVELINKALKSDNTQIIENGHKTAEERSLENVGKILGEIYKDVYSGNY